MLGGSDLRFLGRVGLFEDLPERVFSCDLAVAEFQQVNASDLNVASVLPSASKRPLRTSESAAGPLGILPVVDVGDAFEACCQAGSHFLLSEVTAAAGPPTTWHVEHTLVMEVGHDSVQVVAIEGV